MTYSRPDRFLYAQLDSEWTEDIVGRDTPVPKPKLVEGARQERIGNRDLIEVKPGSRRSEPINVGWTAQRVDESVTLDIRTDQGEDRLWGVFLADGSSERYGGLLGETQRILDAVRTGDHEYDLIDAYEVRDLSDTGGPERDRAVIEVEFSKRARTIWTDPGSEAP